MFPPASMLQLFVLQFPLLTYPMASFGAYENERTPKRPRWENHDSDSDSEIDNDVEDDSQSLLASQPVCRDWHSWSEHEVVQNLIEAGISEESAEMFRDHGVDGAILNRVTVDQLKDMGIQQVGTQQRIMKALEDLGCFDASTRHLAGTKVFNDPVHGHMEFHPLCVAIIDTPQFQRLRYLKQLGACYFVFPGAAHNRFEHCLGVCHLAGQLVRAIQKRQPRLHITDLDVLCVQIAGLCHDLGHGPFSHLFDSRFIPSVRKDLEKPWEHEDASLQMFDYMVESNNLVPKFEEYGLNEQDRTFIKEQIKGKLREVSGDWPYEGRTREKAFLYEIVANKRNGIDVDKWDYFLRDCHHLGMRSSFDHTRFIHFARVIKVGKQLQICVRDKEVFDMYELFHTRHALHRRAYQHKVVQSVENMLIEAMILADKYLRIPGADGTRWKISECIEHMDAYTYLTDHVFHQILLSDSQEADMVKAREILHKIQCRKLYKCVGESVPTKDKTAKDAEKIREDILKALSDEQKKKLDLTEERVRVQLVSLDFGMKNKNPVDELRFYSKGNENHAKSVKASEVSHMVVPQNQFKEQLVRIYLVPSDNDSDTDEQRLIQLRQAFRVWCKNNEMKPPRIIANLLKTDVKKSPQMDLEATPPHALADGRAHNGSSAKRRLPMDC
ncbi:hypothetical protein BaRGS_00010738 [Batillaria attramentaria]|uniref:Deoxynucleoside triphosphate triphosphohydrolase SAMHD1 n=1 Tax=Batillaria attramentaria TaxID=370345 RepID=A0ABD0LFJ2_9CAEN